MKKREIKQNLVKEIQCGLVPAFFFFLRKEARWASRGLGLFMILIEEGPLTGQVKHCW
jgi:hypothetical protein